MAQWISEFLRFDPRPNSTNQPVTRPQFAMAEPASKSGFNDPAGVLLPASLSGPDLVLWTSDAMSLDRTARVPDPEHSRAITSNPTPTIATIATIPGASALFRQYRATRFRRRAGLVVARRE
jgi:hypothetical protein